MNDQFNYKEIAEEQCNRRYHTEMWKDERVQVLKERAELLAENERLRKALSDVADVILKIDWTQVALNHAEPCCDVDECGQCIEFDDCYYSPLECKKCGYRPCDGSC